MCLNLSSFIENITDVKNILQKGLKKMNIKDFKVLGWTDKNASRGNKVEECIQFWRNHF